MFMIAVISSFSILCLLYGNFIYISSVKGQPCKPFRKTITKSVTEKKPKNILLSPYVKSNQPHHIHRNVQLSIIKLISILGFMCILTFHWKLPLELKLILVHFLHKILQFPPCMH